MSKRLVNPFNTLEEGVSIEEGHSNSGSALVETQQEVFVKSLKKATKDPFIKNEYEDPLKDVREDLKKTKSEQVSEEEVSSLEWIASILLMYIPIINFVSALIFLKSKSSPKSKKNWAKANIILILLLFIAIVIFYALALTVFYPYFDQ